MATVAMVTMKDKTIYFLSNCNKISQEWFLGCVDVHLGFDIFKMAAIVMVTMKVKKKCVLNPILMKLHRNGPLDVQMCNKFLLNYEFQNVEYQVGNGFSLAEFV